MSAEIINIHELAKAKETQPETVERLYRLIDNDINTINEEAIKQQELVRDCIQAISEINNEIEHILVLSPDDIPDTD